MGGCADPYDNPRDELINFFEDIFIIFRGPQYNKDLHGSRKNLIMDHLSAIGGRDLIFFAKGLKTLYSPITNEEKLFAQYPISAFLANLRWFYGAPVKLTHIKDLIDTVHLEKCEGISLYDIFIKTLVKEYSNENIMNDHSNNVEYMKYLSRTNTDTMDEFGVLVNENISYDDFEIIKAQDRVIRVLNIFCNLFLDHTESNIPYEYYHKDIVISNSNITNDDDDTNYPKEESDSKNVEISMLYDVILSNNYKIIK